MMRTFSEFKLSDLLWSSEI